MKRFFAIVSITLAALILSACGGTDASDEEVVFDFDWNTEDPFYGETLTIAIANNRENRNFARVYMQSNPGVTIEIIDYTNDTQGNLSRNLTTAREEIGVQLMAGNAPTLIEGALVDYLNPAASHLFADWRPIMASAPHFNEEDFFMNVFEGLSLNDRLFAFPLNVDFYLVLSNNRVPGLLETMQGRGGITAKEMIELAMLFNETYGNDMITCNNLHVYSAAVLHLENFFDFSTGRVDFVNDEFINLITDARNVSGNYNDFDHPFFVAHGDLAHITELSFSQYFRIVWPASREIFDIFETDAIFVNPVPLVNDSGELLVDSWGRYVLNASATPTQQALALDFILFMSIVPEMDPDLDLRDQDPNLPQHRMTFAAYPAGLPATSKTALAFEYRNQQPTILRAFWSHWRLANNWNLTTYLPKVADHMMAQMTQYLEKPMARLYPAPDVVLDAMKEILGQFNDGLITAEAAANDLQNRITLILMEIS